MVDGGGGKRGSVKVHFTLGKNLYVRCEAAVRVLACHLSPDNGNTLLEGFPEPFDLVILRSKTNPIFRSKTTYHITFKRI